MGISKAPTAVAVESIQSKLCAGHLMKAGEVCVLINELRFLKTEIAIAEDNDYFKGMSQVGTKDIFSISRMLIEDKGVDMHA